jgi:tetratricopeptide (TPR) repeat protein
VIACFVALLATLAAAPQDEKRGTDAPADALQDDRRLAALRADPRALPRAAEGRWEDFDPAQLRPETLPPGFLAAARALRAKDVVGALGELLGVLRAAPDFPPALHELGVLYFRMQRYGDALVPLERFLELQPARVGETRVLGHAYYSLGRFADAERHYRRVVEREPGLAEAWRGLALARLRQGDAAGALEHLERVLELEPGHADAHAWRAHVLFDEERLDEALAAAKRARDLDPYQPRPWFLLGRIQFELGRPEEARAAQRRYEELQRAHEALRAAESALRMRPGDLELQLRRVDALRRTGDVARVRKALDELLGAHAGNVALHARALELLDGLGDREGARTIARALEALEPDEVDVWKLLRDFYARAGDREGLVRAGERHRRLGGR